MLGQSSLAQLGLDVQVAPQKRRRRKSSQKLSTAAPPPEKIQILSIWNPKSIRFQLAIMICFAIVVQGLQRMNLGMAIVCMVNSTALALMNEDSPQFEGDNGTNISNLSNLPSTCTLHPDARLEYEGEFVWTSTQQSVLFSAIFWGGLVSGFPSGFLADRYGPKNLVFLGATLNVIGSLLTPVVATMNNGYYGLFILRFLMGVGQGFLVPCTRAMMSKWYPAVEKGTVLALCTAGNQIAGILSMPLSASLCQQKRLFGGWPSIFYLPGIASFVFLGLWILLVTNNPEKSTRITEKERNYIVQSLNLNLQSRKAATNHTPWRKMLSSGPLIACVMCNFYGAFFSTTFNVYLPTYFKDVLFFDLKTNGLVSALPHVGQWVIKIIVGVGVDWLKKTYPNISHTFLAKIFNSIGSFGTGLALIGISFVTCETPILGVVLFCTANGCFAAYVAGFLTSLLSIAPQYTGIVNSFGRLSGQCGSLLGPYMGTQEEWRVVFLAIAAVAVVVGVVFAIFGSADIQPWALNPSAKSSQIPLCVSVATVSSEYQDSEWVNQKPEHQSRHNGNTAEEMIDLSKSNGAIDDNCSCDSLSDSDINILNTVAQNRPSIAVIENGSPNANDRQPKVSFRLG